MSGDRYEHATPEDAARWLAEHYALPRRPRLADTAPLPILGAHPDLSYVTGAMQPIEYELAEGSSVSGREIVRRVVRRGQTRFDAHMAGHPLPAPSRVIVPTETHVNVVVPMPARASVALVIAVMVLVASFVWGAAGMPL